MPLGVCCCLLRAHSNPKCLDKRQPCDTYAYADIQKWAKTSIIPIKKRLGGCHKTPLISNVARVLSFILILAN